MECKICSKKSKYIFNAILLNKYDVKYYHCEVCGFLQTEEQYWVEEAYAESINISDTGYMQRNQHFSDKVSLLLVLLFNKNKKFLDYAAGYGVFVRMMRDIGFDFYWDDKYTENIFAKGFNNSKNNKIEAITTFESFEHFINPMEEINNLLKISKNIIFSTELLPNIIPKPKDWWYYGLEHGQHVSFYSSITLNYIANKYGLFYYNMKDLHIFSENKISFLKLLILRLHKYGISKILKKTLKSKTWSDYILMSKPR